MTKKQEQITATQETTTPVEPTDAQKIWDAIKGLKIDLYGLPGQTIEQNCTVVPAGPEELYVILRSGAVLPALEAAIATQGFIPELDGKYVIIKKVPKKKV